MDSAAADAFGSICFLALVLIAYRASAPHWLRAGARPFGLVRIIVNLVGCVFFGISAVAGLPRSLDRLADQPSGGELERRAQSCLLPHPRGGHNGSLSTLVTLSAANTVPASFLLRRQRVGLVGGYWADGGGG